MNVRYFDVRKYLDDKHIQYFESGKNVSAGWIGMACLWCPDPSHHLGIHLDDKRVTCWRCGPHGDAIGLVMKIERVDANRAKTIALRYYDPLAPPMSIIRQPTTGTIELPTSASPTFMDTHMQWLVHRGFTPPEHYIQKYGLLCSYIDPDWGYRIIIPIYIDHRLVAWVGRDVTGKSDIPYKNSRIEESIIDPKHCLYNIDTVKKVILIVEGVTDVWRIGDGAVCTFGTVWTKKQLMLIRDVHTAHILFDAEEEAQESAQRLASLLTNIVNRVKIWSTEGKNDPAELTDEEARKFRREIFGRE